MKQSVRRTTAIIRARLREFYRDRASLVWNIAMPLMIVVGFATLFSGEPDDVLTIGILNGTNAPEIEAPFLQLPHVSYRKQEDREAAIELVRRHQLDMLYTPGEPPVYWINTHSARGAIAERLLLAPAQGATGNAPRRQAVSGEDIRYVDWLMPGVLAMNMMFSCLWGVGWVVVRYRKNGVLRRLQATPLTALEFITAQVIARLLVIVIVTLLVYLGAAAAVDFTMRGSHLALFLVFFAGAVSLISVGLLIATRIKSEELADGLLNLLSWPMMFLSGVWFSMENTSTWAQGLSQLFPLTHLVNAARRIMIDGAGIPEIAPELAGLCLLSGVLLLVSAKIFRWD